MRRADNREERAKIKIIKIGEAELDREQIAGMIPAFESCAARPKVLIFLKSGQTVTVTLKKPCTSLRDLLEQE